MRQATVVDRWLTGSFVYPMGLWGLGDSLYSYHAEIARRGGPEPFVIVMLPGPKYSVTTQRHRALVRSRGLEMGLQIVDPELN